jgi:hypothetical protein
MIRAGIRPMISMATVRTISSIVVLRSGCIAVKPIGTSASPIARTKRCHADRCDPSTAASTSSSPSLASSEGWKVKLPIPIHRVAPLNVEPATCTAARRTTAAT